MASSEPLPGTPRIGGVPTWALPAFPQNSLFSPAIDWSRAIIVVLLLAAIFFVNVVGNIFAGRLGDGILLTAKWRPPDWRVMRSSIKGAVFLVALVATAAMMPVERLPAAS